MDFKPAADDEQPNEGYAVSLLPDGRIVAAGTSWFAPPGGTEKPTFTVARMYSSGDMDKTFNVDGDTRTVFNDASVIRDMAVIGDKILAVGYAGSRIAMTRYTSTGQLDTTFGTNGKLLTRFSCMAYEAKALALSSGRGESWFLIGGTSNFTIWPGDVCIGQPSN
jgi:uncharacterized delta-60 repeat protein